VRFDDLVADGCLQSVLGLGDHLSELHKASRKKSLTSHHAKSNFENLRPAPFSRMWRLSLAAVAVAASIVLTAAARPNVLFIVVDDLAPAFQAYG
jgi:hypothetical protein